MVNRSVERDNVLGTVQTLLRVLTQTGTKLTGILFVAGNKQRGESFWAAISCKQNVMEPQQTDSRATIIVAATQRAFDGCILRYRQNTGGQEHCNRTPFRFSPGPGTTPEPDRRAIQPNHRSFIRACLHHLSCSLQNRAQAMPDSAAGCPGQTPHFQAGAACGEHWRLRGPVTV